jgi:prepilin-type N-terminal cleavage/methylation domain-containing protein
MFIRVLTDQRKLSGCLDRGTLSCPPGESANLARSSSECGRVSYRRARLFLKLLRGLVSRGQSGSRALNFERILVGSRCLATRTLASALKGPTLSSRRWQPADRIGPREINPGRVDRYRMTKFNPFSGPFRAGSFRPGSVGCTHGYSQCAPSGQIVTARQRRLIPATSGRKQDPCKVRSSTAARQAGFTLVEMMITLALTVVLLGAAFDYLKGVEGMTTGASAMSEVNDNLRGAANLIQHDLYAAGTGVPALAGVSAVTGVPALGIPLPSGNGSTAVNRPGPGNTSFPFNAGASNFVPVITPGYQLSGAMDGQTSDDITILKEDDQWTNASWSGASQNWSLQGVSVSSAITYSASGYTVTASFPSSCIPCSAINVGDLLLFTAGNDYAMGMVTTPAPSFSTSGGTTTVTIVLGNDSLGLNQYCGIASPCPNTIGWVNQNATYPAPGVTLTKIDMITYYLDNSNSAHPYTLMRMLGNNVSKNNAVAYGVNFLSVSYDVQKQASPILLNLSVSNPACPTDCINIHTANLTLSAVSSTTLQDSGQYYGNTIVSKVALRNLVYGNAY